MGNFPAPDVFISFVAAENNDVLAVLSPKYFGSLLRCTNLEKKTKKLSSDLLEVKGEKGRFSEWPF